MKPEHRSTKAIVDRRTFCAAAGATALVALAPHSAAADTDEYNPTDAGWTFTGQAGVQEIGSGWLWQSPMPPQGIQTAFIQSDTGVINQSLIFSPGKRAIRFTAAQRTNGTDSNAGPEGINVYFDSKLIGSFDALPSSGVFTPLINQSLSKRGNGATAQVSILGPGTP